MGTRILVYILFYSKATSLAVFEVGPFGARKYFYLACCQGLVVVCFSPRRESGFEFSSLECCKPKIENDMFEDQIIRDVLFWHVRGSNPKRSPPLPFLRSGR